MHGKHFGTKFLVYKGLLLKGAEAGLLSGVSFPVPSLKSILCTWIVH